MSDMLNFDGEAVIDRTWEFIRQKFTGEGSGHDYWHMYRVWQLSIQIAKTEPTADPVLTQLAALLHDIADWKFHDGDTEAGPRAAREWLQGQSVDEKYIEQIAAIIRTVSFKGAGVKPALATIEGKIVSDADKLDAIGAIGIGRAFAYGGSKNRPMYDPDVPPVLHATFEDYKRSKSHTINHFYEKLLLLKDQFYTDEAKKLAEQRHQYMETFLQEFYDEWNAAS